MTDQPTPEKDSARQDQSTEGGEAAETNGESRPKVMITSDEGVAMADTSEDPTQGVPEPAKVMRIGTMIKQLLEEVKAAPLDDAARDKLADLHARSVKELKGALSDELAEEIDRIVLPLSDTPSEPEIRVAHAQLVGWLEGLFHGIQTALMAQQLLAQNQLKSMRRQLPPGMIPPQQAGQGQQPRSDGPGQYL